MTKSLKQLSLVLLTIALLISCKKSSQKPADPPASEGMKFTLNGKAVSYAYCKTAVNAIYSTPNEALIIGLDATESGTSPNGDEMEIVIQHDINSIQAGDIFPITTVPKAANTMGILYTTSVTGISQLFGTQNENPMGTVTITKVDTAFISGTFSGNLYSPADFYGTTLIYAVTNGTFTAKKIKI